MIGHSTQNSFSISMCQGDDVVLQKAVTLVLQNREDFVAILFYASWCPFSKIFRTNFQKLSSFFPTIAHFSFEESRIKPRMLSRYGVRAFPTLFLVNSTMRVRYHGSRTMNSLAMFYKDVTGMNPVSLDAISLERMEEAVNIIENDKKTEQEDSLFMFARSPDRLLHQDTCLALASSFVLLRLLCFLLPKLNACVKQAWRMQFYELKRLFPTLS
uniref:Thioredoxin domain-containing protein n=3 Tax=Oryza punctata TaxID=4537 RepID=A0A0E0LUZ8_ORYPU